jgi:hypothetical protein
VSLTRSSMPAAAAARPQWEATSFRIAETGSGLQAARGRAGPVITVDRGRAPAQASVKTTDGNEKIMNPPGPAGNDVTAGRRRKVVPVDETHGAAREIVASGVTMTIKASSVAFASTGKSYADPPVNATIAVQDKEYDAGDASASGVSSY